MTTRPHPLLPIHPSVLELMGRLLHGDSVIRHLPEGWFICHEGSGLRCPIIGATVEQLVLHGLLSPDPSQAIATYRLNADGRRAYYAGGYVSRITR
jgi:hypothetical protein